MTQEDRELLLKDLCARLPYGVKLKSKNGEVVTLVNPPTAIQDDCWNFKPYLRPLSSMTDEEINEFILISDTVLWLGDKRSTCILSLEQMDWLNKNMFDYRGLIPMGIALEAPEEMYNTSPKWTPLRSGLKENEDGQIVGGLKL